MDSYINLSAYQFIHLDNLISLQSDLRDLCDSLSLKGTIILASEGINLFISAPRPAVEAFYRSLQAYPFGSLQFKESLSDTVAFKRMRVKIKQEIIPFGLPDCAPPKAFAPFLTPAQLKQWLDENKAIALLDTRNDYEIQHGKFTGAIDLSLRHFRDLPEAAQAFNVPKDTPVVTYCTGGIRCEKAAPYLLSQGFLEVYQLQGGILKYFQECGRQHFEGECFVFDERIAL